MISFNEANQIISNEFKELQISQECVDLPNSVNRILSEDVYSDLNLPPFNNSAMDGYAIMYNEGIRSWKITGEISAGNFIEHSLDDYSAVTIMTGGKLPANCDTIIPVEFVLVNGDEVKLKDEVEIKKGQNIRKAGDDLAKGKLALPKDTFLKPHHIAAAASCGKVNLKVYGKLRIGVLATGDELVDIHETPQDDKIRCSNLYSLLSAIRDMNMQAINFGIVKDNKQLIRDRIKWAFESDLDIFLTTGGVSVGKFDYLKEIYEELGVDIKFWQVYVKPGKPALFGTYKNNDKTILVFGLPGNPVSCLVNFILFVKQNILRYFNNEDQNHVQAVLEDDLKKEDKKRHFMRGFLTYNEGAYYVKKVGSQSSGNIAQMAMSNCLIVVEEERFNPAKGELVKCIMI